MATTYTGWPAAKGWSVKGGQLEPLVISGEPFSPGVRAGDVADVFWYLAQSLNDRVEPIVRSDWHQADDWGYNFRLNRNANNLSCHAGAVAIDYNATRHPNGKRGTFSPAQVRTIRQILAELGHTVRWGGDFTGTPDEMHFEIIGTAGQVAAQAASIRSRFPQRGAIGEVITPSPSPALPSTQTPWMGLPAVRSRPMSFQRFYNATPFVPALLPVIKPVANNFGPQSEAALKKLQAFGGTVNGYRCTPLVADGLDGPLTKAKLWSLGWRG